jgi:hypothetical protein
MDSSICVATMTGTLASRAADHVPLDDRHLLERHLETEIAARHHDRVHEGENARQVGDDLRALELRDDGQARPLLEEELAHLLDVGGRAHERHGDVVHAVLDPEAEIVLVLGRETGNRQRQPRQRHTLVVGHDSAGRDAAVRLARLHALDDELDRPVVHPDLVAGLERGEELRVVEQPAAGPRTVSAVSTKGSPERSMARPPTKVPSLTLGPWRSWMMVTG